MPRATAYRVAGQPVEGEAQAPDINFELQH
jgi:hypothetical protein